MRVEDLMDIRTRLRIMWRNVMPDGNAAKAWYDTFRHYDFDLIDKACVEYMRNNKFQPNPADILMCIPAVRAAEGIKPKFSPKYVKLPDGREVRAYRCQRCKDTGLIVWEDIETQAYLGRPCTCEAAIENYGSEVRNGS